MVIIDVHGDFARNVVNFIHNEDRERLVYISSTINRECHTKETYTAVVNPFIIENGDNSVEATSIYANEIANAIEEILQSSSNTYNTLSIQMSAILRPVIFTVMYSCLNPSFETVARFFLDRDGQNTDLLELGKQSPIAMYRQFFEHDWKSPEYTITKRSIRTKIIYMMGDPMLTNMICGKSTVNVEKCLHEGKVIVVNVSKSGGSFCSSVFSRLMIAYIHAIMIRRDALEINKRTPCFLYLDEFQNMVTSSLVSSLAECRKYGLNVVLATQSTAALSKEVRSATTVNCSIKMVSLLDHEGKVFFSKELNVPIEMLQELQALSFVVRKNNGKDGAFKFRVPILAKRHFLSKDKRKELMDYILYQSGTYVPVSTSPAPPPVSTPTAQDIKQPKKQKRKKDDPFDDNIRPAFN